MKLLGLIGYPLSHSFSKKYFSEKFEKEQIKNFTYQNFPLSDINEFPDLLMSNNRLSGLNVTSPYKESVIKFLNKLDTTAAEAGAVNTVKIIRNKSGKIFTTGYNTDIFGFKESLKKQLTPYIKNALILGTGGAAKAVAAALKQLKINFKFVSGTKKNDNTLFYEDLTENDIIENRLIINATPLGMNKLKGEKPNIPYHFISNKHLLFDLVYNPSVTPFLSEGVSRNAKIKNGLEMLHLQAEKAWQIFISP